MTATGDNVGPLRPWMKLPAWAEDDPAYAHVKEAFEGQEPSGGTKKAAKKAPAKKAAAKKPEPESAPEPEPEPEPKKAENLLVTDAKADMIIPGDD